MHHQVVSAGVAERSKQTFFRSTIESLPGMGGAYCASGGGEPLWPGGGVMARGASAVLKKLCQAKTSALQNLCNAQIMLPARKIAL
jgi:hypothetical protein